MKKLEKFSETFCYQIGHQGKHNDIKQQNDFSNI